jgi:hyaluronan synthase
VAAGQDGTGAVARSASRHPLRQALASAVLLAGSAAWGARHLAAARAVLDGHGTPLGELYALTFLALAWQVTLYAVDRPFRVTPLGQAVLDTLNLTIAVPLYNEDVAIARRSLMSMLRQSRRVDHVIVVDDGSDDPKADYSLLRHEFGRLAELAGTRFTWIRIEHAGKRHAQAAAVEASPDADVYVTVDSDSELDEHAAAELIAPFADPRVMSVAGVFLAANNTTTLLARLTDLIYLPSQLMVRGGMSVMRSVLVNSGAIAAYRAGAVREALPVYLGETFFGVPVGFSDDSMLTLLAYLKGRAVHQPSAFAFAAMPETFSHHKRQYLRWMRGSFIRSWWRFRYLPLSSYAFWWHLAGWVLSAVSAWAFADVLVSAVVRGDWSWSVLLVPAIAGYGLGLPYLTVSRSDETWRSRLLTWSLAPLAVLWSLTVLRAWRWYGAATCRTTGWGTRQNIEVTMEEPDA